MAAADTFGVWLKRRRKILDLTQKDLADRVGCSVAAIQKIEREERRPSRQIAALLASSLEIPEEQRAQFLKIARGERRPEALPIPAAGFEPPVLELPVRQPLEPAGDLLSGDTKKTHLPFRFPYPPNPLIGRETELSQIAHLLAEDHCRLLTLTGEGGIGKTRLAVEVARLLSEATWDNLNFPDGTFFISLAPVRSIDRIALALADGIDFKFYGSQEPLDQLIQFLVEKHLLLILDNLEHLVDGANLLAEILSRAPGVKMLVTSRERLRLQGEWIFAMAGLPYPMRPQGGTLARRDGYGRPESYSAVALFIQNARRCVHNFELTPETEPAIFEICRMVDGMPLGLELAAAWLSTLTPQEIAEEIRRDLGFLASPTRDIPERHRSIHAVFDHSLELLSEEAKAVFCRLSVFHGGFRRAAAESIAGANLLVLSELVEKSLLRRLPNGLYELHELVRQYAAQLLRSEAEIHRETRALHSSFYLSLLKTWEVALRNEHQKEALEELTSEIVNIGLAWEWAVEHRQILNLRKGTLALMIYHELRNLFLEGERLFEKAQAVLQVGAIPEDETDLYAQEVLLGDILSQQAWFSYRLGKMDVALPLLRQSMKLLQKYNESIVYGDVLWYYASACWFAGEYEEASWAIEQGLDLNAALGRYWQIAMLKINQGGVCHEQGRYAQADQALSEALNLSRTTGDPRLITTAISFLGRTRQTLGRFDGLQAFYQEALALANETGDRYGQGLSIERLAYIAQVTGDAAEAFRLYGVCAELYREIGDQWSLSRALNEQARFALQEEDASTAMLAYQKSIHAAVQASASSYLLDALIGIAVILEVRREINLAIEIARHVGDHPSSTLDARNLAKQLQARLVEAVGEESDGSVGHLPLQEKRRSFEDLVDFLRCEFHYF